MTATTAAADPGGQSDAATSGPSPGPGPGPGPGPTVVLAHGGFADVSRTTAG
ncbi:hypothetical protein [Streptomyces sp. NPDC058466]|uniref:hypothetical protein n=1 Tax=Streptomyces sp. NPDC058466 TaxID=3346512 RepID=UPI00365EABCA